jgi:hypothetical protein
MVRATDGKRRNLPDATRPNEFALHASSYYSEAANAADTREKLLQVLKESLAYTYSTAASAEDRLERLNELVNDLVDEVIRLQSTLEMREENYRQQYSEQKRNQWMIGLALSGTTLFSILAASLLLKPDDLGGRFATYFFAGVTGSASAEAFRRSMTDDR